MGGATNNENLKQLYEMSGKEMVVEKIETDEQLEEKLKTQNTFGFKYQQQLLVEGLIVLAKVQQEKLERLEKHIKNIEKKTGIKFDAEEINSEKEKNE